MIVDQRASGGRLSGAFRYGEEIVDSDGEGAGGEDALESDWDGCAARAYTPNAV